MSIAFIEPNRMNEPGNIMHATVSRTGSKYISCWTVKVAAGTGYPNMTKEYYARSPEEAKHNAFTDFYNSYHYNYDTNSWHYTKHASILDTTSAVIDELKLTDDQLADALTIVGFGMVASFYAWFIYQTLPT